MKRRSQLARPSRQLQRSDATSRQHVAGAPSRRPRGLKTRRAILKRAVNIASLEGLEGLTLGKLATQLRISKSGLFAHFGSKEDLQCAVVEEAREIFTDRVIRPAFEFCG